jgi:hypothetical protein
MEHRVPAARRRLHTQARAPSGTGRPCPSVAARLGTHQFDRRLPLGNLPNVGARSVPSASDPFTRLSRRRLACLKFGFVSSPPPAPRTQPPQTLCRGCGKNIAAGRIHCAQCSIDGATERLGDAARIGRVAARSPEARAKHSASRRRHAEACSAWDASNQPNWLTSEVFSQRIQPLLASVPTSVIRSRIGVSRWYASRIRQGYRPHPRHWQALAELVGVTG